MGLAAFADLTSPPPIHHRPPPQGNGSGNGNSLDDDDGFDPAALPSRQPSPPGNGQGSNGYPHGESSGPTAGPATAEYIYRTAESRLYMRGGAHSRKAIPDLSLEQWRVGLGLAGQGGAVSSAGAAGSSC